MIYSIYPNDLEMHDSACRKVTEFKALNSSTSYSNSIFDNVEKCCFSACPSGVPVEYLHYVSDIEKGLTIIFNHCLVQFSYGSSEANILKWLGYKQKKPLNSGFCDEHLLFKELFSVFLAQVQPSIDNCIWV